MTLQYGFYNSLDGDRKYNAQQFGELFDGLLTDGIIPNVGEEFALSSVGESLRIGTGRAWFNETWTYNDDEMFLDWPSSSNVNHRIDAIVLTVDKRLANRANSIDFLLGTPSASPVAPTPTPVADVYQYVIGTVYRARDSATVSNANITSSIGTATAPYASNALPPVGTYDTLSYKRSIVRGNYLGNVLSSAQKSAIQSGSFEGIYLGDYWTYDGVDWRVVDFDYWLNKRRGGDVQISTSGGATMHVPTGRITDHHVVIMPDTTAKFYSNTRAFTSVRKASNCGMWYSETAKNRYTQITNKSVGLFGANGILHRSIHWTTTLVASRYAMNARMEDTVGGPPTEAMIWGSRNMGIPHGNNDHTQLALYAHDQRWVWAGQTAGTVTGGYVPFWTLNQYTMENWTCVHEWAGATAHNPYNTAVGQEHSYRPVFGVTGL